MYTASGEQAALRADQFTAKQLANIARQRMGLATPAGATSGSRSAAADLAADLRRSLEL